MKKSIAWLVVMAIGFMLMLFSYFNYQRDSGPTEWRDVVIYVGKGQPDPGVEGLSYVEKAVRLLPMRHKHSLMAEQLVSSTG